MDLFVSHSEGIPQITIFRCSGNLDAKGAIEFDAIADEHIEGGASDILVDLGGVEFMSSAGVRSLNNLFYALHPYDSEEFKAKIQQGIRDGTYKAPHLVLLSPTKRVEQTLKMVGLDMYLEVFKNEGDALASFKVEEEKAG